MKEVTYEDWQKNPTPRMMWVWDNDEEPKEKRMVLFCFSPTKTEYGEDYPVLALNEAKSGAVTYRYCAEIEKTRRMTNKELSWWLSEKPHRERKYTGGLMPTVTLLMMKKYKMKKFQVTYSSEKTAVNGENHLWRWKNEKKYCRRIFYFG